MAKIKKTKNQLRREKLKEKKLQSSETEVKVQRSVDEVNRIEEEVAENNVEDNVEQIIIDNTEIINDPLFEQFRSTFEAFNSRTGESSNFDTNTQKEQVFDSDNESIYSQEDDTPKLTKKQKRSLNRIPLADLKAYSANPKLVDLHDIDADEPKLLVYLKNMKNCVIVPSHWQSKRDFLSSNRGVDKPQFELPDYILNTGIMDLRDVMNADNGTLKQDQRARVQPTMGKLDMDFNKLYEAFYKYQTKPKLYKFGDLFYENRLKNEDLDSSSFKPGIISDNLRNALGIPAGAPPPWILVMQSIGTPPAYPFMKIPGVNAPLENAEPTEQPATNLGVAIERERFGQLQPDVSEDEYEEESEEEEKVDYEVDSDTNEPVVVKENVVPITEYGVERAQRTGVDRDDEEDSGKKRLYTVLKEGQATDSGSIMGGERRTYEFANGRDDEADEKEKYAKRQKVEKKFKF